jgi:hypothetical protein
MHQTKFHSQHVITRFKYAKSFYLLVTERAAMSSDPC